MAFMLIPKQSKNLAHKKDTIARHKVRDHIKMASSWSFIEQQFG